MPMTPHAVCARLLLEVTKRISTVVLRSAEFGSQADLVMLCTAVWIGQAENRPMTSGKLSAYIGIPRPSVARKLAALQALGIVKSTSKGRWSLCITDESPEEFMALSAANSASINRAYSKLSKMDGSTIALGEVRPLQGMQSEAKVRRK